MSKSFALAGLRIGLLTTRNTDLLKKFATYKDYTTICSIEPSEILSIAAFRPKDRIFTINLDIIEKNIKILDTFFAQHVTLYDWHRPSAGQIGFLALKTEVDTANFCVNLVENKGIMLLPSGFYDFKGNYFRISFAHRNMPEALEKLEEYPKENYPS